MPNTELHLIKIYRLCPFKRQPEALVFSQRSLSVMFSVNKVLIAQMTAKRYAPTLLRAF